MNAAVFLDRDNTLIANDGDLGDPSKVVLLDGVRPGLRALREAGFQLVVVTNQGGVARGVYGEEDVDAVHQRIAELVNKEDDAKDNDDSGLHLIDRFYYCPYHPKGSIERYKREHPWRKPAPGMLLQAASDLQIDLSRSFMIGDQYRDIEAGHAAGCQTILVGGAAKTNGAPDPDVNAGNFETAVAEVLKRAKPKQRPAPAAAKPSSSTAPRSAAPTTNKNSEVQSLQRAVLDLSEELRSARQRRSEFTPWRMAAALVQLSVLLCGLLGLLQMNAADPAIFLKWIASSILLQLFAIFLLVADQR